MKGGQTETETSEVMNFCIALKDELYKLFGPSVQALLELSVISQDSADAWKCLQEKSPSPLQKDDGRSSCQFCLDVPGQGQNPASEEMVFACTLCGMID